MLLIVGCGGAAPPQTESPFSSGIAKACAQIKQRIRIDPQNIEIANRTVGLAVMTDVATDEGLQPVANTPLIFGVDIALELGRVRKSLASEVLEHAKAVVIHKIAVDARLHIGSIATDC